MQFCTTPIAQLSLFLCKLVIHPNPIHFCIFSMIFTMFLLIWTNKKWPTVLFYDRTGTS